MQKLLTLRDLLPILQVSEPTIRRWLAEARRGTGNFPKPINGFKRKLLFHPAEIERWAGCQQQPPPVAFESTTQRKKRHAAAMESLSRMGVNIKPNQGEA